MTDDPIMITNALEATKTGIMTDDQLRIALTFWKEMVERIWPLLPWWGIAYAEAIHNREQMARYASARGWED